MTTQLKTAINKLKAQQTDSHNKEQKATDKVKAVIPVEVPKYQIGQEVSIYFKDTMYIKGICQEKDTRE